MVQILITKPHINSSCRDKQNSLKELSLIELQGALESEEGGASDLEIGQIIFDQENNPVLTIGQHRLIGKTVKLKKPFAVLRKQEHQDSDDIMNDVSSQVQNHSNQTRVNLKDDEFRSSQDALEKHLNNLKLEQRQMEIIGIIRQKYLFNSRPEHVASEKYQNLLKISKRA